MNIGSHLQIRVRIRHNMNFSYSNTLGHTLLKKLTGNFIIVQTYPGEVININFQYSTMYNKSCFESFRFWWHIQDISTFTQKDFQFLPLLSKKTLTPPQMILPLHLPGQSESLELFLDMSPPSPQVDSPLIKQSFLFQPTLVPWVLVLKWWAAKPEFGNTKRLDNK